MADNRTLPFKERAYQNFQATMASLKKVEALSQEKNYEDSEDYQEPLSIEVYKEVTITLCWGGPSSGYTICFDQRGEIIEGYYFFADWFEHEEFKLSREELERVLTIYPVGL